VLDFSLVCCTSTSPASKLTAQAVTVSLMAARSQIHAKAAARTIPQVTVLLSLGRTIHGAAAADHLAAAVRKP
jgi:hypothetical protein